MLAQVIMRGWSIGEVAIAVIIFLAIVACVYAFCAHSGVTIPPLVVKLFWIVVGAALCILAIRFLMSM